MVKKQVLWKSSIIFIPFLMICVSFSKLYFLALSRRRFCLKFLLYVKFGQEPIGMKEKFMTC